MLARAAQRSASDSLFDHLLGLLDDRTEHFHAQLAALPKGERYVYATVANLWQPSSPRTIAARATGHASPAAADIRWVSTMLGRLLDRGVVAYVGRGRRRQYIVTDRLFCFFNVLAKLTSHPAAKVQYFPAAQPRDRARGDAQPQPTAPQPLDPTVGSPTAATMRELLEFMEDVYLPRRGAESEAWPQSTVPVPFLTRLRGASSATPGTVSPLSRIAREWQRDVSSALAVYERQIVNRARDAPTASAQWPNTQSRHAYVYRRDYPDNVSTTLTLAWMAVPNALWQLARTVDGPWETESIVVISEDAAPDAPTPPPPTHFTQAIPNPGELKRLSLHGCFAELPKTISALTHLKVLHVHGGTLTTIPDEIGELKALEELWIDGRVAPEHESEEEIRAAGSAWALPQTLGALGELRRLRIRGTVTEIPQEVWELKKLEELWVDGKVRELPTAFAPELQKSLKRLRVGDDVHDIPEEIASLRGLRDLALTGPIAAIPVDDTADGKIGVPSGLERLTIGVRPTNEAVHKAAGDDEAVDNEAGGAPDIRKLWGGRLKKIPAEIGQLTDLRGAVARGPIHGDSELNRCAGQLAAARPQGRRWRASAEGGAETAESARGGLCDWCPARPRGVWAMARRRRTKGAGARQGKLGAVVLEHGSVPG